MFEAGETFAMLISFDGSHLRRDKGPLCFEANLNAKYVGHDEGVRLFAFHF